MPLSLQIDPGNVVEIDDIVLSQATGRIVLKGSNSTVRVGKPRHFVPQAFILEVLADGQCEVVIEPDCFFNNLVVHAERACSVSIGGATSIRSCHINLVEDQQIVIGPDCMMGNNIRILTSDFHPIFDLDTGEWMNSPNGVTIGQHVWLADDVIVLKGASVGAGSAVGIRSVVSGAIPEQSLAAGVPARVLKSRIRWERELPVLSPVAVAADPVDE